MRNVSRRDFVSISRGARETLSSGAALLTFFVYLVLIPFVVLVPLIIIFLPINLTGVRLVISGIRAYADPGRIDYWQPSLLSGLFSASIAVGMFDYPPAIVPGCHLCSWLSAAHALILWRQIARKHMNIAVIALLLTGLLLGVSEPVKLYGRQAFWVKMMSLALALAVTYFIFNPQVAKGGRGFGARAAALLTVAAWLMVAMAGRWIGFS